MSSRQHLSDEAVAACADGVLGGHATDRAVRHLAECAECSAAVRTQREVTSALRTAPAPALPTDLLDRLRGLPASTPVTPAPTVVAQDGTTMLSTSGFPSSTTPFGSAAFAPPAPVQPAGQPHRGRTFLSTTAAVVALMGAIAAGTAVSASEDSPEGTTPGTPGYVNQFRPSGELNPDDPSRGTMLRDVIPFEPFGN